jgi:hypothetical protein
MWWFSMNILNKRRLQAKVGARTDEGLGDPNNLPLQAECYESLLKGLYGRPRYKGKHSIKKVKLFPVHVMKV